MKFIFNTFDYSNKEKFIIEYIDKYYSNENITHKIISEYFIAMVFPSLQQNENKTLLSK